MVKYRPKNTKKDKIVSLNERKEFRSRILYICVVAYY